MGGALGGPISKTILLYLGGPISKTILLYLEMVLLSAPLKTKPSQLQLSTKQNFYIKLATKKGLNNVKFEPSKPSKGMPRTQNEKNAFYNNSIFNLIAARLHGLHLHFLPCLCA